MAQQWSLVLQQLAAATRIIRDGHELTPAWRIEAEDDDWLILTRFDSGRDNERVISLVRRFMAWKRATSFVLCGSGLPVPSKEESISAIGHVLGERLAFLQRIHRAAEISFGGLECAKPRDVPQVYWSLLPQRDAFLEPEGSVELQSAFGADGEFPAVRLQRAHARQVRS